MSAAYAAPALLPPREPEPRSRILLIDDDPQQQALLERVLGSRYDCKSVGDVAAARLAMATADYELIVCDLELGGESGLDLLREIPSMQRDAAVIMVTGTDDMTTAEAAIGFGAYGYIVKPYRAVELMINVSNALRRRALELAHRAYAGRLEGRLLERTTALNVALSDLEAARLETLHRLSLAVEARDRVTADHVEGMVKIVENLSRTLGYEATAAKQLGEASAMHDVGKIGVPDEILLKEGPLTAEERAIMQRHAEIGYHMLAGSHNPMLQLGAEIAWCHHERWDGAGYPRGLAGAEIPESARIVSIVDVYSAMSTDRPYRQALPLEVVLREIEDGAGSQFDPAIAKVFLDHFEELVV